ILGPEPVAANVAEVLEVARIDDVVWTIRAIALANFAHVPHVSGSHIPQPRPAHPPPRQFQPHPPAAPWLDELRLLTPLGRCRGRHILRIAGGLQTGYARCLGPLYCQERN